MIKPYSWTWFSQKIKIKINVFFFESFINCKNQDPNFFPIVYTELTVSAYISDIDRVVLKNEWL